MTFSVSQTASFEAAHYIDTDGAPSEYGRVHGHSFVVTVTCSRKELGDEGWVVDLGQLSKTVKEVAASLDHQILNEVPGLEKPTFENIMQWFAKEMTVRGLSPSRIDMSRPTLGQTASYEVPRDEASN